MANSPPHYTVHFEPTVTQVDAYWMRNYAGDFLKAAKDFAAPSHRFSPVKHYLIGHSIELSLKSFLFTVGYKRVDRKQLNHNLVKALEAAMQLGIANYVQVTQEDRDQLTRANNLYSKKEFEYFESLETIWDPIDYDLDALTEFAKRLYDAIEAPVMASVNR